MAIGVRFGRKDPKDQDSREKTYKACNDFWNQFEKEFGSTECYGLLGYRLDSPEGRKQWVDSGGMQKCTGIIEKTARLLRDLISGIE